MSAGRIRVLIAEDHQIVAEGLIAVLADYPDIEVLGWVPSVAESVRAATEKRPDVVLLDFRLADGTGAEAASAIREVCPDTAAVVLSADDSQDSVVAAVESGAVGYLVKSAGADQVARAVRRAAEGETLIPADQLSRLLRRSRELARERQELGLLREKFTSRELEVLALMAQGFDNRAMAAELTITYATARTHVRNVLQKLQARSQLEAVVRASEAGLIDESGPAGGVPADDGAEGG